MRCAWDHCPTGRSNDAQVSASSQSPWGFLLGFPDTWIHLVLQIFRATMPPPVHKAFVWLYRKTFTAECVGTSLFRSYQKSVLWVFLSWLTHAELITFWVALYIFRILSTNICPPQLATNAEVLFNALHFYPRMVARTAVSRFCANSSDSSTPAEQNFWLCVFGFDSPTLAHDGLLPFSHLFFHINK